MNIFIRSVLQLTSVALIAVMVASCSGSEGELEQLVSEKWLKKYGDNLTVKSVTLLNKKETEVFGSKLVDASFETIVVVNKPFEDNCFGISRCVFFVGSEPAKSIIKLGQYTKKSNHKFVKQKSGWRFAPN